MQVPPGDYYVAEYLNGAYYLSEKFTVNYVKPRPEISVSYWFDPTVFNSEEEGYSSATGRQLIITNKGTADTGPLTITVEGTNPDAFTVSPDKISNIAASGSAAPTVRPAKGLTAGEYYATLKIRGDNVNTLSLNMKFIVTPKMTAIARPTANTGLVYNGKERIGVNESAGYTLTGTYKATDVGDTSYTATATLNSGYKWSDDGTEDVTITWNIGKRDPYPDDIVVTPPAKLVYDGNRKDATAELDSNYTGAGAITISKYVNPDTGEEVQPIDAGTYTVYVKVAGGTNFNAAPSLNRTGLWNFTIAKAEQNAPVGLTASAPTVSGGKGKINRTTANMQYNTNPDATTGWKNCTEGSTIVDPGTYYVRYKGDNNHDASDNVKVIVPEYGTGVTVSGTVTSYNGKNDFTVTLYEAGTKTAKHTATVSSNGNSGQVTQDFTLTGVASGTYDLAVTKAGHLTYTITGVVVGTGNVDLAADTSKVYSTITLLAGDVDQDGNINESDVSVIRYASNINKPVSSAANPLADVDGDGNVNESDVSIVRYAVHINKNTGHCTFVYAG